MKYFQLQGNVSNFDEIFRIARECFQLQRNISNWNEIFPIAYFWQILKSVKAERVAEPEIVEDQPQKSSVPQSTVEEVDDGEGEEVIQAVRSETPKFFPPKEGSDTQSVQSRKSSSASQKKPPLSPHIKSAPKNQTMNKFDLSMGIKKPKKEKKPSGFSKFINMCTGKWSHIIT